MNDEPDFDGSTYADVLVAINWLKQETEKTKQATRDFQDALYVKKQLDKLDVELLDRSIKNYLEGVRRLRDAGR